MRQKKKSLTFGQARLKKGQLLIEQAEIIANGFDPVKCMAACAEYDRLLTILYRKNTRVK